MRCEDARAEWTAALDGEGVASDDALAHLDSCDACVAFKSDDAWLRALLQRDPDEPPRPGFDTRFYARLSAHKRGEAFASDARDARPWAGFRQRLRWPTLGLLATGGAVVAGALFLLSPPSKPGGHADGGGAPFAAGDTRMPKAPPGGVPSDLEELELALDLALVEELPVVEELATLEAYASLSEEERALLASDDQELDRLLGEVQER